MTPGISTKLQQALGLHQQGQIARAAVLYQEILRDQPGHFDALHLLGVASLQSGNPEAALELIGRAIHINPRNPDALTNLGNALRELGRHAQALTCYERALAIRPDSPESHYNRALALQELHRHDAALAEYDRALALRPGYIEARYNRGVVLQDSGRHEDAALAFAQLLEIAPDCPYAAGKLRYLRLLCCDWRDYHAEQIQLVEAVAAGRRACDPFSFTAMSNTAAAQLACAKTYATDRYPPAATPLWSGERYAHDKIRVAYLSADFHEHATTHLMAGLFRASRFRSLRDHGHFVWPGSPGFHAQSPDQRIRSFHRCARQNRPRSRATAARDGNRHRRRSQGLYPGQPHGNSGPAPGTGSDQLSGHAGHHGRALH